MSYLQIRNQTVNMNLTLDLEVSSITLAPECMCMHIMAVAQLKGTPNQKSPGAPIKRAPKTDMSPF